MQPTRHRATCTSATRISALASSSVAYSPCGVRFHSFMTLYLIDKAPYRIPLWHREGQRGKQGGMAPAHDAGHALAQEPVAAPPVVR